MKKFVTLALVFLVVMIDCISLADTSYELQKLQRKLGLKVMYSSDDLLDMSLQKRVTASEVRNLREHHVYNKVEDDDIIVTDENGNPYTLTYGIPKEKLENARLNLCRDGNRLLIKDNEDFMYVKYTPNSYKGEKQLYQVAYCEEDDAICNFANYFFYMDADSPDAEKCYGTFKMDSIKPMLSAWVIVQRSFIVNGEELNLYVWAVKTCKHAEMVDAKSAIKDNKPAGRIGRWSIPSVGVDVAVYNSSSQATADREDSACYFKWGDTHMLGDHDHQGFDVITQCEIGDRAYFDKGNEVLVYECVDSFFGSNYQTKMVDEFGRDISKGVNRGGITCYTCYGEYPGIAIVLFKQVKE